MEGVSVPGFLTVGSIVLLAVYFFTQGPSAVWGGATIGLVIGLVVGLVKGDLGNAVMWGFSIGTFSGFAAEVLGWAGGLLKRVGE